MIKVLHVYKTSWLDSYGGVETSLKNLTENIAKNKDFEIKVLFLSSKTPIKKTVNNVHYKSYRQNISIASCPFSWSFFMNFRKEIAWADIIHYHFPWPFADFLFFLFFKFKKITLVTYHSDIVRQRFFLYLYKPLMSFFLNNVNLIVATSPNYKKSSSTLLRFNDKTRVIPLGLNLNDYPNPSSDLLARWKRRINGDYFIFIGVLRYYKGIEILINAAKYQNFKVVIVGSGPLEPLVKNRIIEEKIENIILLSGVGDLDKHALIKNSIGLVLPSIFRSEAFGMTLLEGAIFSKPLISSDMESGMSYIIKNNISGFLLPPKDFNSLKESLLFIYKNKKKARSMGIESRKRFNRLFNIDIVGSKYTELYNELIHSEIK